MKFALGLENTKDALFFFDDFLEKSSFCPKFSVDVFVVQEFLEQDVEIKKLVNIVEKKLEEKKIKGEIIVERGNPSSRVLELIEKRDVDVFVCRYEHSFFRNSFFELIVKNSNVPILTLR